MPTSKQNNINLNTMKAFSASFLSFIISAVFFCVALVTYHFTPVKEKTKGLMSFASVSVSKVAHNSKGWMYAEFSRLREYSQACPTVA